MKKKIFTVLILGLLLFINCISQDSTSFWYQEIYNPDGNFYSIQNQARTYFNSLGYIDSTEGSDRNVYKRWEYFWQDRVYEAGDSLSGSFKYTDQAIVDFLENIDTYFPQSPSFNTPWEYIGRDSADKLCMGIIVSLAVDTSSQDTNVIYAGSNASGLWKSDDDGKNWNNITDNIGFPGIGVSDIVLDHSNSNVIYIATGISTWGRGYGMGIWKSTNGGTSWFQVWDEGDISNVVEKLVMDPNDSDNLYALVVDKVYRTTDAGQSWELIYDELYQPFSWKKRRLVDISLKPSSSDTLYIASDGSYTISGNDTIFYTSEIWRSGNIRSSNVNWTRIDNTPASEYTRRLSISTTSENSSFLFCGFKEFNGNYILRKSRDYGNNWVTILDTSGSTGFRGVDEWRNELVASPTDTNILYIGGYYITRVVNKSISKSGTFLSEDFHVDVRDLLLVDGSEPGTSGNSDIIYVGHDGGVSKSIDGAQNWIGLNGKGLRITQYYGLGISELIPDLYAGGTQDNGIITHNPDWANPWKNHTESDNYETIINYSNPNLIYSLSYGWGPDIHYSYNRGKNYGSLAYPDEPVQADWPLTLDKHSSNKLTTGLRDVYTLENYLSSEWTRISEFVLPPFSVDSNARISDIEIYSKDDNIIYVSYGERIAWNGSLENKLFKSINGGITWVDLSTNLEFLEDHGITDIEVHPFDPNVVWLSLGGFSAPGETKVIKTTDSFSTYQDYSDGLPDFPVSCIKSNLASNLELFLGNDVGVFYRNDTMDQWVSYGGGMPICIISDIEIDSKNNKIKVATFGRGLWENDGTNPCGSSSNDTLFITSDTSWSSHIRLHKNVFIEGDVTLTIKGIVSLGSGNKIIVDRGGELIIDGGELKSSCNGLFWQGIDVWGNKSKSQYQSQHHGKLILKNNAVIRNAIKAISTVKRGPIFYELDFSGGIIYADSCYFSGNYIDLDFYEYKNYLPNDSIEKNEVGNLSYFNHCNFGGKLVFDTLKPTYFIKLFKVGGIEFNRCSFRSNVEYPDTSDFYNSLVYLLRANNIKFSGCLFKNDSMYFYVTYNKKRGIGIYSYNSTFSVIPYYSTTDTTKSTFSKLTYGVKALTSYPEMNFRIDSCVFDYNSRGVYSSGISYANLRSNTFNIPRSYISWDFPYYGIYLDNCTKYHVENNSLTYPLTSVPVSSTYDYSGIICNNSGDDLNMIYRNFFSYLRYGIIAQNNNRGKDNFTGLKIKCNEFSNCRQDVAVTSDSIDGYGISRYQGYNNSNSAPAGNLFSHFMYGDYSDYDNELKNIIYFHHDSLSSPERVVPKYYTQNTISLSNVSSSSYGSESCPSDLSDQAEDSLKMEMNSMSLLVESTQSELDAWLDGGSTETLINEVNNSTPQDAIDLTNNLISDSPYLSDSVMVEAIKKESVLTPVMLTDILVANPQSAKSQKVDDELDQRIIPLSDEMRENIEQGIYYVSSLELIESKMSYYMQERSMARNRLANKYLLDHNNPSARDSLYQLYDEDDLTLQYIQAFVKLYDLGVNDAKNDLYNIPLSNSMTIEQQNVHQLYCDYIDIIGELDSLGLEFQDLSHAQKVDLYQIESNNNLPASLARNTLIHTDTLQYTEPIIFPSDLKRIEVPAKFNKSEYKNLYMGIFPNPTSNYITISHNYPIEGENTYIQICNVNGIILEKHDISTFRSEFLITLIDYKPGIYFCNLVVNDEILLSQKFIVIK